VLRWIENHPILVSAVGAVSVLTALASMVIVPVVIVRTPPDYFAHDRRPESAFARQHAAVRMILLLAKNALGVLLLLAGAAMLVLPGQGILTTLVGFLIIDFPRKYRLEKWVISRPRIAQAVNWLRNRYGRTPLIIDQRPEPFVDEE